MRNVSLIPFVCGAGASKPGCEHGPLYAVEHSLIDSLHAAGIASGWAADPYQHWAGPYGQTAHAALPPRGSAERFEIVNWHNQALARNVVTELENGNRVVTIGGDHSMAAGSVAGARIALGEDATLGMVWVDAHADLHTMASSVSKALHGMPMGTLTGLDSTLAIDGCRYPVLLPENIIYAGLRDVDQGEFKNAETLGLILPMMKDLREQGIGATLQDRITDLMHRCDHIVLSIDLDGFSDALAPAVGTPVVDGFIVDEILPTLAGLIRSYSVPVIDIVEFNPTLYGADKTYRFMVDILTELLPAS